MSSHIFQSTTSRRLLTHHSTHPGFHSRKQQILSSLTSDPSSKIDKSPKGSVDEAILPLIELLNRHDDYVTTSSCSGRIAIYCAGKGTKKSFPNKSDPSNKSKTENHVNNHNHYQVHNDEIEEIDKDEDELEVNEGDDIRHSMKGGGRWLFVTHSRVDLPKENNKEKLNEFLLKTIFGVERDNVLLLKDKDNDYYNVLQANDDRIVYFKFEPMVN
jgi:tRNA wybutosine-synthesizing protein 3